MAKMDMKPKERVRVKLECLKLLTELKLDKSKQHFISGFVATYLELNAAEEEQYVEEVQKLPTETREEIMETMNSWERVGLEKGLMQGRELGVEEGIIQGLERGRHQAAYNIVVRFLNLKINTLPDHLITRLKALSASQLESLSEVALHAETAQDVEEWLDKRS